MPDAEKKIRFKTSIEGGEDVKKEFEDINQSIDKTSNTADTKLKPAMVDAEQYTMRVGEAAEGTTSKFAGFVGQLVGGASVIVAVMAAKAAIEILKNQFIDIQVDLSNLTGELKDNWTETYKAIVAWGDFEAAINKMSFADLEASLEGVNIKLKETQLYLKFTTDFEEWSGKAEELRLELAKLEKERAMLEETLAKSRKEGASADPTIIKATSARLEIIETITKEIKDQNNELEKQVALWRKIIRPYEYSGMAPMRDRKGGRGKEISGGGGASMTNNMLEDQEQIKEQFRKAEQDMQQFSQASANVFAQNMNQAWESIFGEANSLFEQMVSAWGSMLFEKIGFGIFNMLFGGIDILGFARNITAGNATAAKYGMGK